MVGHACASTNQNVYGSKNLLSHKNPLAHQATPNERTKDAQNKENLLEVMQSQKTVEVYLQIGGPLLVSHLSLICH